MKLKIKEEWNIFIRFYVCGVALYTCSPILILLDFDERLEDDDDDGLRLGVYDDLNSETKAPPLRCRLGLVFFNNDMAAGVREWLLFVPIVDPFLLRFEEDDRDDDEAIFDLLFASIDSALAAARSRSLFADIWKGLGALRSRCLSTADKTLGGSLILPELVICD